MADMSMVTDYLKKKWDGFGGWVPGAKPSAAHEKLRGVVPDLMFEIWDEFGFASVADGSFFLCDPLLWQDAADAWTQTIEVTMDEDRWVPLVRGPFGQLELWGPHTGMSLSVVPLRSAVYPADNSDIVANSPDAALRGAFMSYDADYFAMRDDATEKPLLGPVRERLGVLAADEMYTFVPVPQLGGELVADHAVTEQAVPQIILLRALDRGEVAGDIVATQRQREGHVDDWIG